MWFKSGLAHSLAEQTESTGAVAALLCRLASRCPPFLSPLSASITVDSVVCGHLRLSLQSLALLYIQRHS